MPQIIITYKTYTTTYPRLTEKEFYALQEIKKDLPEFGITRIKNRIDFQYEFFNEFKISIGWVLFLGCLLGLFELSNFFILIFVPLIIWLILGGLTSILNFIEDFNSSKKYCKYLNEKFSDFGNYEQYLNFHKYESFKL